MKFVKTTDDTLGGRLLDNGDVVTAIIKNGKKTVEIVKATTEQLENLIPAFSALWNQLSAFFESIFNRFPCIIVIDGKEYVFTEQRAIGKAEDRAFYMNDEDKNDVKFMHSAKTLFKVRNQLHRTLKDLGYFH